MKGNILFNYIYNSFNQVAGEAATQSFKPQITAQMPQAWFGKESITLLAADGKANKGLWKQK